MKKIVLTVAILILCVGAGLVYINFKLAKHGGIIYLNKSKTPTFNRSPFNRPEVEEEIKQHAELLSRIDKKWDHIHAANRLAEEGRYDEAIAEAMKSLDYTNRED